jgi:hypothetical protein
VFDKLHNSFNVKRKLCRPLHQRRWVESFMLQKLSYRKPTSCMKFEEQNSRNMPA